jgi:hypothetical protein
VAAARLRATLEPRQVLLVRYRGRADGDNVSTSEQLLRHPSRGPKDGKEFDGGRIPFSSLPVLTQKLLLFRFQQQTASKINAQFRSRAGHVSEIFSIDVIGYVVAFIAEST